jgi:cyclic pyranopterin phosphate synthase
MTTNGATMRLVAETLRDAGLRRVNISLDTLDRAKFQQMTRRDELDRVLDGIEAAKEAGFDPVKVNAVIERGVNDDEIVDARRRSAATTASRCASSSSCRSTPTGTG